MTSNGSTEKKGIGEETLVGMLEAREERKRQWITTILPIIFTVVAGLTSSIWYMSTLASVSQVEKVVERVETLEKQLLQLKTKYDTESNLRKEAYRELRSLRRQVRGMRYTIHRIRKGK